MAKAEVPILPPLNFCPNMSLMYQEHESVLDRYRAAKAYGFRGVEIQFPYSVDLSALVAAKKELDLDYVLINAYPGDLGAGDLGLAALPGREADFADSLKLTFEYLDGLQCKRVHIMSGKTLELDKAECLKTLERNLRQAVPELEKRGVVGLIEPVSSVVPGYYLNDFDNALAIIKKIDSPFLRLQLDIFHLQQIHGNLTQRLKDLLPWTGHIQIAQVPDRNEPDSLGEIDYNYVLLYLQSLGYEGWIGLEYRPLQGTEKGLDWIQKLGFKV